MSALGQVLITLEADRQMRGAPGLRARVQQHLLGILEAAIEIKTLHPDWYADGDAPLLTRVDQFEISYSLDVSSATATVLYAASLQLDASDTIPCAVLSFAWQPAPASAENDPTPDAGHSRIA